LFFRPKVFRSASTSKNCFGFNYHATGDAHWRWTYKYASCPAFPRLFFENIKKIIIPKNDQKF